MFVPPKNTISGRPEPGHVMVHTNTPEEKINPALLL